MQVMEPVVPKVYAESLDPRTLRISVKNVKEWDSPEGGGFSCTLYFDGKLVADVYNDGMGGGSFANFKSRDTQKLVHAYVETLPWTPACDLFPEGYRRDLDWVVSELIDWTSSIKQFKRWNKRSVCFQVIPGSDPSLPQGTKWMLVKCLNPADRETIKGLVRKKHEIDGQKVIFTDDFC